MAGDSAGTEVITLMSGVLKIDNIINKINTSPEYGQSTRLMKKAQATRVSEFPLLPENQKGFTHAG